jgi:hypothetical protein
LSIGELNVFDLDLKRALFLRDYPDGPLPINIVLVSEIRVIESDAKVPGAIINLEAVFIVPREVE